LGSSLQNISENQRITKALMDETFLQYIFIGILIIIPILGFYFTSSNARNTVIDYLHERGAKNIVVFHEWFDIDRDTMTFSVEFTHPNGNKVSSRCKLRHWGLFVDGEIFWSESINLESPKVQVKQSEYFEFSEKIHSRFDKDLPTYEISTVLSMPNSEDKIVMMKYIDSFNNVLRCKNDGTVIWEAELPTNSGDVYTNIAWQENQLTAFSRSCVAVTIDTETGKILLPKNKS
jgi:hypothetical protein